MRLLCYFCGATGTPFEDVAPCGEDSAVGVCKVHGPLHLPNQRRAPRLNFPTAESCSQFSARYVGLELEMFHHQHDTDRSLQLSTDWRLSNCGMSEDGSIRSNSGIELKTPPAQGDDIALWITAVSKIALSYGMRVDASCGVHVHVDVKQLTAADFRRLFLLVRYWEPVIYAILPPNRWMGGYGGPMQLAEKGIRRVTTMPHLEALWKRQNGSSRYRGLNFESYKKYGTVEFRYHSGTLNAEKLLAWAYLCQRIVDTSTEVNLVSIPHHFDNFDDRLQKLAVATKVERLLPYLTARIAHFGANTAAIESWYATREAEITAREEEIQRVHPNHACVIHPGEHNFGNCLHYQEWRDVLETFRNHPTRHGVGISVLLWYSLPRGWFVHPGNFYGLRLMACICHGTLETLEHGGEALGDNCRNSRDMLVGYLSARRQFRSEAGMPPETHRILLDADALSALERRERSTESGLEEPLYEDIDEEPDDDDGGTNEEDT